MLPRELHISFILETFQSREFLVPLYIDALNIYFKYTFPDFHKAEINFEALIKYTFSIFISFFSRIIYFHLILDPNAENH